MEADIRTAQVELDRVATMCSMARSTENVLVRLFFISDAPSSDLNIRNVI
jgi:hypothetical protein